jgi:uncharacterized membrane protein YhaH (DUF805 family)
MDWGYIVTNFTGRINRAKFWAGSIVVAILSVIVQLLLVRIGGLGLAAIVSLVFLYPAYAIWLKRSNDRDRPPWMVQVFLALVVVNNLATALIGLNPHGGRPFILSLLTLLVGLGSLWVLIDLGCLRGTVGQNQYGPDPLGGQPV